MHTKLYETCCELSVRNELFGVRPVRGMEVPSIWKFITPPPMPYMSSRALKGLRDYKYVAGGYTWLDRVHTPVWNQIVEYFPLWLAPNLITLIGTAWLVLAYLVTSTYLTELKGPPSALSPSTPRPTPALLAPRCETPPKHGFAAAMQAARLSVAPQQHSILFQVGYAPLLPCNSVAIE